MIILKFGGSSLATAANIKRVAEIIDLQQQLDQVVVVVSALQGVTDDLDSFTRSPMPDDQNLDRLLARHVTTIDELAPGDSETGRLIRERVERIAHGLALCRRTGLVTPRQRDAILATGERLSNVIVAAALRQRGIAARSVDGSQVLATDSEFGGATLDLERSRPLARHHLIDPDAIPIVSGFVAADPTGATTTLGRGGSDLSATALGALLGACRVEIFTDVEGVMSGPPSTIRGVRTLPRLSFAEAAELAHFGAKILCPSTIAPVIEAGIPVVVRCTLSPDGGQTVIDHHGDRVAGIKAVAGYGDIVALRVKPNSIWSAHAMKALAAALPQALRSSIVASQTAADGSWLIYLRKERLHTTTEIIGSFSELDIEQMHRPKSLLALIGDGVLSNPAALSKLLGILANQEVQVETLVSGASGSSLALILDSPRLAEIMNIVHREVLCHRKADAA